MWAIRKASLRIKSQLFSPITFRASYAKFETASSSYTDNTGFSELPPHISDRSLILKRFYSQTHVSQSSFVGKHRFFSQAGAKCSGEEDADFLDGFSEVDDTSDLDQGKNMGHDVAVGVPQNDRSFSDTEDEAMEYNRQGGRGSSGLFKAIVDSSSKSVIKAVLNWLERNDLSRLEISLAMSEFCKRRMYSEAFQLSKWLEAHERKFVSNVLFIAKIGGPELAEKYIKNKIPESFKGEVVYEALLANYVCKNNRRKAEQVFNVMKKLKLPITASACNQLLLLYKRTDQRKMADMLLFMEEENIKPSLFTYRLLLETKGQSGDLIEQILESMKGKGLEPDLKFQAALARHYVNLGIKEKAKAVLKEMEGGNLNENRRVCSSLFPLYALLGSEDDVKRVWKICESNPQLHECLSAIDAFGKVKSIKEAEVVFDKMLKKWKQLSAKHFTAMLKIYTDHKLLNKGKNVVKRMNERGCGIGPDSLDVLVKFYLEAGEIEKAGLILNTVSPQRKGRPLLVTYMMILDEYAKRGDVCNAEKTFERMRLDGYVLKVRQYNSLLRAYINGKIPADGFRKRLEADRIFPNKLMEAGLAQVDAFMKTAVSDSLA